MNVTRAIGAVTVRRRSDKDVFERAFQGDPIAFSEVYRRYHARVFAYCLARSLSPECAQDASQEVFLRLLSADSSTVRDPVSWLFGTARHVCIDVMRKGSRQTLLATEDAAAIADARRAEPAAEDDVMSKHEARAVFLALRRMRPRYRTALVLRDIHQQPVAEIAEALGTSEATAYTLLSRARDAFGATYSEVLGLRNGCREAVELLYRRGGSGISQTEAEALEAHLATCPSCSREARRAEGSNGLRAFLPLLPLATQSPRTLLSQAAVLLGSEAPALNSAAALLPVLSPSAPKVVAAVVASGIVAAAGFTALPPSSGFSASTADRATTATHAVAERQASRDGSAACESEPAETRAYLRSMTRTREESGTAEASGKRESDAKKATGECAAVPGSGSGAGSQQPSGGRTAGSSAGSSESDKATGAAGSTANKPPSAPEVDAGEAPGPGPGDPGPDAPKGRQGPGGQ